MNRRQAMTRALAASLIFVAGLAGANDPLDPLLTQCEGPAGDPAPGTPEFVIRDLRNIYCSEQRHVDSFLHPTRRFWAEQYGSDPYRDPALHRNIRFRHDTTTISGAAAEIFRPCTATSCPALPEGLQRFEPPYPVVILMHGFASDKRHLWWAAQPLAERGYFVIAVNGTADSLPGSVLNWVNGAGQAAFPGEMDASRVGAAWHSLGAENSTRTQGYPRVSAIISWDPCNSPTGCSNSPGSRLHDKGAAARTPTLFFAADYSGFPGYPQPRTSVPGTLRLTGFTTLRNNGVDAMLITPRATTHLDWAGNFTFGSRYGELISSYFGLAWFDRYLKGKLVLDGQGNVVTSGGRTEAQERAYRQAIAQEAAERLTATVIDGSADRHNISQGYWDPLLAVMSGDPMYGGNVPYSIAGQPVADRLSFYHRSVCYVSVPDYRLGNGGMGEPIVARADSTDAGDMRKDGCPLVALVLDTDGDGVSDELDQCPNEAGPANNGGCPLPPPDTTPDPFGFTSVSGVSRNTTVSSNVVTIQGLGDGVQAPISVSGDPSGNNHQYRINGGSWTSASGSITNGQTVQVRHVSASAANSVTETVLTIGGVQGRFRSTTAAGADTDPDAFSFGSKTNVPQSTLVVSDPITPMGYDAPAVVKAGAGTEYSVNCTGSFVSTQGSINPGDTICVRHMSASAPNTLRKTSLQIGRTVGYFTTRTAAQ
jgi:hypothetical protein